MTDPIIERAIALLRDAPRVALPLDRLARQLGHADAGSLGRHLAADPRLLVLDSPALPGLALLAGERWTAYDAALGRVGLTGARSVVLVQRATPPLHADAAELLRHTTARLLEPGPAAGPMAAAAELAHAALLSTLETAGGVPSTTPLPRPPPSR